MSHMTWMLFVKDTQRVLSATCQVLFIISLVVSIVLSIAVIAMSILRRNPISALGSTWLISITSVMLSGMALLLVTVLPALLADLWSVLGVVLMLEVLILHLWYLYRDLSDNPMFWVEVRKQWLLLDILVTLVLLLASILIAFFLPS